MVCNMVQEAALSAVRTVVEAVAVAPRSGLTALPPAAYGGGLVSLADSLGAAGHALLPLLLLLVPEFCGELLTAAQPEQLQMAAQQALRRLAGCSDLPLRQQPPDWLRLHPLLELHACASARYAPYNEAVLGTLQLLHACGLQAELGADDSQVGTQSLLAFAACTNPPASLPTQPSCLPSSLQAHTVNVRLPNGTCRLLVRSCKASEINGSMLCELLLRSSAAAPCMLFR